MVHIRLETEIQAPLETVFDLARDIDFHQQTLADTGERAIGGRTTGLIEMGESVTWRGRHLGLRWELTSMVTDYQRPIMFTDEQVTGPFKWFRHEHHFRRFGRSTIMIDDWRHIAPFGLLGRVVDAVLIGPWMKRVLKRRAAAIAAEAERGTDDGKSG